MREYVVVEKEEDVCVIVGGSCSWFRNGSAR